MGNDPEDEFQGLPTRSERVKRPRDSSPHEEPKEEPLIQINKSIFGNDNDEDENDSDQPETEEQEQQQSQEVLKQEDVKVSDEGVEARRNLLNFFEFSNSSKQLPQVVEGGRPIEETGPAPKLPRIAHYNQHNGDDEVKYVEECRGVQNRAIPIHETVVSF